MIANVQITGIAGAVPQRVVTNKDLEKLVDTSDEWIIKRTGVVTRHIAAGERAIDMAARVAVQALEQAGVESSDVGLIVCSTITSEYMTPAMASYVQKQLDIKNCACMDVSAGCTGFVYALVTAASLMDTLGIDNAVVIASETLSNYIDWTDRTTCVLFGDGAAAMVLQRNETSCMHYPLLSGSPDNEDVIVCERENRPTPFNNLTEGKKEYIRMNGREVFTYAVGALEDVLNKLKTRCKDRPFTKIIPHQANEKIIDYVIRKGSFQKNSSF